MATTTYTDQYTKLLNSTKAQLQTAQDNAGGGWGGSQGQLQDWRDKANSLAQQYAALQSIGPTIAQIDQNGLGSDPSMQNLISQMMQSPSAANAALLNQSTAQQSQLASQQQQLQGLQQNITTQDFGGPNATMTDALTNNQGMLGQLNQFETGQTADTFNKLLSPEISMALGGQGLLNSGANVELQSKALAGLQLQQQQSIENAGLGMASNIQGLQQQSTLGNIGTQQQNMANLQQTQNFYTTMSFQQSLMQQQAALAQQLAQYGGAGGGGIGSMIGGVLGAAGGAMVGGPAGAMAGYGLGSSLGGGIGNAISPGTSGQGTGAYGSTFFAASQSMPKTWGGGATSGSSGVSGYGNGSSLSLSGASPYGNPYTPTI